jgi:hypothetical protein
MNLQSRLARLEATSANRLPPPAWVRCIVHPDETLDAVVARDFGGTRPENLIVRHLVPPEPRP